MTAMRHCATCDGMHPKGSSCPISRTATQWRQDARRGTRQQRGYDTDWMRLVQAVIVRDRGVCQLQLHCCTQTATTGDHVMPLSRGGARLDPANVQASCRPCNSAKRDR